MFGGSSELNALGDSGAGETVRITSLDSEDAARGWPSPDFIKIDAEGEEERILAGGRNFFARHSPLIMFEIKAGDKVNEQLRALFPAIGYRLFRQLGGAPILVPDDAQKSLDGYELNLFAAKADRVSALSQQGFLVDAIPAWVPGEDDCKNADLFWRSQKFAPLIDMTSVNSASADSDYRNSLAAYATWRAADQPIATRCAALAVRIARSKVSVCARAYGRASVDVRPRCVGMGRARRKRCRVAAPPPNSAKRPNPARRAVLASACARSTAWRWAVSQPIGLPVQRSSSLSGPLVFRPRSLAPRRFWLGSASSRLPASKWNVGASCVAARAGLRPSVPARLCQVAPDHLNADIWRAGKVPGTIVGP